MYYNDQDNEDRYRTGFPQSGGRQGMGMGMGMWQDSNGLDNELAEDIAQAIIGEVHAYNFYEVLAEMAETERERQIIKRIQQDEARHYHWFTMMLQRMGINPPQIPIGELPSDFESGIRKAIENELEAAEFYQNIAYRSNQRFIQMHFMHASHDEQRHASLFQNMLMNLSMFE